MSLWAGAGVDGLQYKCRTCVIGELDWSPGRYIQNIGRLSRFGQEDPVMAYFPISTSVDSSDPIMADVCKDKELQAFGIMNPDAEKAELITNLQVDPKHIEKMAKAYLYSNNNELLLEIEKENESAENAEEAIDENEMADD